MYDTLFVGSGQGLKNFMPSTLHKTRGSVDFRLKQQLSQINVKGYYKSSSGLNAPYCKKESNFKDYKMFFNINSHWKIFRWSAYLWIMKIILAHPLSFCLYLFDQFMLNFWWQCLEVFWINVYFTGILKCFLFGGKRMITNEKNTHSNHLEPWYTDFMWFRNYH